MSEQVYAEIVVDVPVRNVDRVFSYIVPADLFPAIKFGMRVIVPFAGRKVTGYVVGFSGITQVSQEKLKPVLAVLDNEPVITEELWTLARWMKAYYLCTLAQALKCMVSPAVRVKAAGSYTGLWIGFADNQLAQVLAKLNRSPKQSAVIKAAAGQPGLSPKALADQVGVSSATVSALVGKGLLQARTTSVRRNPYPIKPTGIPGPVLTPEQAYCAGEIIRAIESYQSQVFALHGITGSGKTEIYLNVIARALVLGRKTLITVPEIALTGQMVNTFKERYGDTVAVLHSALSAGERYDEWQRIRNGDSKIVLGTRSAVFAPLSGPGLLIIDEEHEAAYKQDDQARYHAREVALQRAKLSGAVVILGSATMSLESYCRAQKEGPYRYLSIENRIEQKPLPQIKTIDLRAETHKGNPGIFSLALLQKIEEKIRLKEQTILFINRRGFSPIVICRDCGFVLKCPHCDISLTYHSDLTLRCHYCNYISPVINKCSNCASEQLRFAGTGTQKVEEEIRHIFPSAGVLRMDADTTSRKGAHAEILKNFLDGKADILIGTQMLAKGLNLPNVTLVGVINADTTLHMPDFRAAEKTFQLLTQVAGRAGRGEKPGEVIIQTYNPEHYSIKAALNNSYKDFYAQEMIIRRELGYPPFSRLIRIILSSTQSALVQSGAFLLKECLLEAQRDFNPHGPDILGPAPAPLHKIKEKYRWQIVLKGKQALILRQLAAKGIDIFESRQGNRLLSIIVDVEPQNMM
jgi:primosomal protein N' (replication factor Y)